MKIPFVDLKAQYLSIENEIQAAINNVIQETAFIKGKYTAQFEDDFKNALNADYCVGVGNGTDALSLSLKAIGIKQGDEVITAANSFIASSESITNAGGKVEFADCDKNTYTIDPVKIEEKITSKTRAIVVVHLYGQPADMDAINKLAKKYNLKIIEDSAQAHFAEYNTDSDGWKNIGTLSDAATFSFFPGKNLGAYGDGGAIITNNKEIEKMARMLANHGRISKYDHEFEGVNSRLDGLQAAILSVKLKYLASWTDRRRKVAAYYSEMLKDIPEITIPFVNEKTKPAWHLYVIQTKNRDKLAQFLNQNGIACGIHYPIALPNLKAYEYLGYKPADYPIASSLQDVILSLPVFPEISREQQDFIISRIIEFHKKN